VGRLTAALLALAALLVLLFPAKNAAQEQGPTSGEIKGRITDGNKPLAGAKLSLANAHAGKSYKIKTDDYGAFLLQEAPFGFYDVDVIGADGERLLQRQIWVMPAGSGRTATVNVDISQSKMTSLPGNEETYGTVRTMPEPNIKNNQKRNKAIAKQNERVSQMNTLILQANAAILDQRWQDGLAPLLELTGIEPDNLGLLRAIG